MTMLDPTMSPAPEVRLAQQAVWLIRRCRQVRPWLSPDRPDVVDACVRTLAEQDLDHMGAAHVVQACQALEQALRALGCPRLVWAARQTSQAGPWIGCAPRLGWFILHARQPDGHWLIETVNGSGRHAEWPEQARIAALPLAAGWQQQGSMRALTWQTLQDNRTGLIQVAACTATANLLLLATSLYSMQVYDRVIPSHGLSTLVTLTVGVLIAITLEMVIKLARSALMDHNIQAMDTRLSRSIFERLLQVRLDQFPPSVGTLSSQLRSYEMIRSFASSATLYTLVDTPFALVFLVIMVAIGGGMVAGVAAVFLLLSLAIGLFARTRIEIHTRQSMAASNRKLGLLVEAVDGAERIKSQGSGWAFLNRWNALSEQGIAEDAQVRHSSESATYWAGYMQQVSYVLLIAVGAWIATSGTDLTSGGLIACSIISGRVLAPIGLLPGLMVQWANAKSALDNLERIFLLRGDNHGVDHPIEREHVRGQFDVQELSFAYGQGPRVLSIPQWSVSPGERVAVLGLVGSGKSTLLKLLAGLYEPQAGRVLLDGLDIQQIARVTLSQRVAFLGQDVKLFSGTLRDNLLSGLLGIDDDTLLKACQDTGLINLIQSHPRGLDLPIGEGGSGVSGGQRQAVALTRLLLSRPRVWLLDEPTASMDDNAEMAALHAIERHLAATDTLVLVTHKPRLLGLVNRVVVLGPQGVVLDGPRDQVLQRLQQPATREASPPSAASSMAAPTKNPSHAAQPAQEVA
jgi:ATP-binding cassette subfamily C protein LapB